jgi:hypothetical protein
VRARSPRDWAKWITTGIEDPEKRREIAVRERAVVFAEHLTEHRAPEWVAAWERAADIRSRSQRKGA